MREPLCDAAKCLQLGVKRTSLVLARNDVNDPKRSLPVSSKYQIYELYFSLLHSGNRPNLHDFYG